MGSFDEVVKGCECVMHTASPFVLTVSDPQKDLVDPAVLGTRTVLTSCANSGTVKRVVLTSSMAAITDSPEPNHVYSEFDWNKTSSLNRNPYYFSKTLAEKEAWIFTQALPIEKKFSLVVINPVVVIGPEHNPASINPSNEIFQKLLTGGFPGILSLCWPLVDVRDVAKAHIVVMENRSAEGRFIVCNESIWMKDVVAMIKDQYSKYALPKIDLSCSVGNLLVNFGSFFQESGMGQYLRTNIGRSIAFDTAKIRGLGMEFIPLQKSIFNTCDSLIVHGHVPKR